MNSEPERIIRIRNCIRTFWDPITLTKINLNKINLNKIALSEIKLTEK
jgi:hypothetical protein